MWDLNEWLKAMGHRPWSDKTMVARFGDHSAFAEHQIEKKRVRFDNDAISRPGDRARLMNTYPLPKQYTAWLGVKFKNERRPGGPLPGRF